MIKKEFYVKLFIFISLLLLSACSTRIDANKAVNTTCYHPLAAPIPFQLQPEDKLNGTTLTATRNGKVFLLAGVICITTLETK